MSLLTPDSGLLFWMIVSFGIVFVILSKYGFPVIVKAIEQRKAYIDNSLETARQANERLAHIQAEGEKMLAEAKEKQNAVLKEAFAEKERIIEEARKKAVSEAHLQIEEATQMFGVTLKTDEEIITYAKKLQEKGAKNVLISMAGDGAILITEDGEIHKGLRLLLRC